MYKFTFVSPSEQIPADNERVIFNVNKEKGIVTCVANVVCYNFADTFGEGCEKYVIRHLLKDGVIKRKRYSLRGIKITVIGKAYCDPSDKFDEKIGKRIAETRARKQVYELMKEVNRYIGCYITDMSLKLDQAKEKTNFLYFREVDHERKLVRETM